MAAGLRAGVAILVAAATASVLMFPAWLLPPSAGAGLFIDGNPAGAGAQAAIVAGLIASVIVFVALRHGHMEGM